MGDQIRGGLIQLQVDGVSYDVKGDFTYNIGNPKRTPVIGTSEVHGWTEAPQVPFIEGEATDSAGLSLDALTKIKNATATLQLANGKAFMLRDAVYAGDGDVGTKEGNIQLRFEGKKGVEI